ncbi:unnamed protein product [Urochloa humidicola]
MAEGSGAAAAVPASAPPCRLGGATDAPAPGWQCCGGIGGSGGCGLGLARLVRRLRRRGRRALRAASAASSQQQQARRRACQQYDPLSYARNFDLGGCDADADAARFYYSCSFSSRFVLGPAASSSSVAAAGGVPGGAAPGAVTTS